jgi:hypothetical protein
VKVNWLKKNFKALLLVLTIGHFAYFLLEPKLMIDLKDWEQVSCYYSRNRDFEDGDCKHYNAKYFVFAQPHLKYGEKLDCKPVSLEGARLFYFSRLMHEKCELTSHWGRPQKLFDLGWDAYTIWYGRAAVLYFQSLKEGWPGALQAIRDPLFVKAFANYEHHHYPWLVPLSYFGVLKVFGSPNPLPLIVLQVLLWFLCAWLYRRTWPEAPRYLWLLFAFVPSGAMFMFRLYADIWVVAAGLLLLLSLSHRKFGAASLVFFLGVFLKQEAFLQLWALALTFLWIEGAKLWRQRRVSLSVFTILALTATFLQLSYTKTFENREYYASLWQRLFEGQLYTQIAPSILGYYADVFFRPALWGLLFPFLIFLFWKWRKNTGLLVYLPALLVLVAIPLAYAKYPAGFKEVVLTGSGRALWQMLPLLWLLCRNLGPKKVAEPLRIQN